MKKVIRTLGILAVALLAFGTAARAAIYTYNDVTGNTSPGDSWNAGAGWVGSVAPVSGSTTILSFQGTLAAGVTVFNNDDIAGNFLLNSGSFTPVGPASGTSPVVTISGNPLEFISNSGTAPTLSLIPTGTIASTLIINNNIVLDNTLTITQGAKATGTTLNGIISGAGGLTISGVIGGWGLSLTSVNSYNGPTSVISGNNAATSLTVKNAGTIATSSGYTLTGYSTNVFKTGLLVLDYTGAGNATVNRLGDTAPVLLNYGGEISFTGNTASNTSETFGQLGLGTGAQYVTMNQGSGAVETITAASFSRGSNFATALIRGTNLGTVGSATQAAKLILSDTSGLTLVGTTPANNLGTADTTKNLQIVPYLMGATTAGSTNEATTFVTYDSTLGFRALSTTTEFSAYAAAATGDNVNVSSAVTGAATKTINSLLINAGLTGAGGGSNILTVSSGAIAAITTGTISGFDGITLGNNEGVITAAGSGVILTLNSPIGVTGNGGLTKTGMGTVILAANNSYSGQTTINNFGTLQVGNGGATGDLGNSSGVKIDGGTLTFNRTSAYTFSGSISGVDINGSYLIRAATSTGALTLGSVTNFNTVTDNSTNGASTPTTFLQSGPGLVIFGLNGASGSVVVFGGDGTGSTTFTNTNGSPGVAGQLIKLTSGTLTFTTARGFAANFELDGGVFIPQNRLANAAGLNASLVIKGGTLNSAVPTQFNNDTGSATNLIYTVNQSGGFFNETYVGGIAMGLATAASDTTTYNLTGGTLSAVSIALATDAAGTSTATFNMSGGKLISSVGLSGATSTGAKQAFVWTGGTLATGAFTATNLTSGSGVAVGATTNTLTNGGGILAPGDLGTAGKTTITGNYIVTSANAALAADIGGLTQGSAFQTGQYDYLSVSGSAALGGRLNFSLINSYTPANDTTTLYKILNSPGGLSGSFVNQMTAGSGLTRVAGADGLSSFLVAINSGSTTALTGGLTSVPAYTVALGGYKSTNTYNAASGGNWDASNAGSWTNFDPGSATGASGAIAQFADGASTGSGANTVTLGRASNIQGVQFSSATAGHNYTINASGAGAITFDNKANGVAATLADSSASGNANTINVPITLNSDLAVSVTNASTNLTVGGGIAESAAGSKLTKTGAGILTLSGSDGYTGATTVSAGKLVVSGSLTGSTNVSVNGGATLQLNNGGLITTSGTVSVSGTLALQGSSTVGKLSMANGSTLAATISGTAAGSHGTVTVTGANNLSLGGMTSVTLSINSTGYTPVYTSGNLSGSDKFALTLGGYTSGDGFTNVISGLDPNYGITLNTFTDANGHAWAVFYGVNYAGGFSAGWGAGNDIALMAIPEPQTWLLMFSGIGMLALLRRRR